ncbi:secretion protein EccK [Mycobacterium hubeiense]|uniref:secretion protein EccK n=1 Tax=Mycobacterium hubeiense TaxID=1867256 RepID=UPI000C7F55E3|nr:secretion protein EccK [Mycobacterium sp. QGD 101]
MSARRAERDAIAAAATAGALRRKTDGFDPLRLARQIAAALNAPQSIPHMAWGFLWATGVTVDGTILVANTYGLGYIPEGVNLPEQARMVSADDSIAPSERAKWVAYPYLALQGWAQHKNTRLQAVIGTEEQLKGLDPGARKVYLDEADIPANGTMQGRSRLEVIAPGPAAQLTSTADASLIELLPTRPVDDNPPEDRSEQLWFDMLKPLMRSGTGRETAHLEAFVTYASHKEELLLHQAHTATDATTQRVAIADWAYWQHLSVLNSDALTVPASS